MKTGKKRQKSHRWLYWSAFSVLALIFALSLEEPLFEPSWSPVLYDREGRLLGAQVADDEQWRFPSSGKLNEKFTLALIEAEDRRFKFHLGIDLPAIVRAAVQNIQGGKVISGASTITMQCIRLSRTSKGGQASDRTFLQKIVEAVLAFRLELAKTKDEILELYAANAPFGANVVGLEAAAWRWFGRSSEELSWAEAATLAVLPNSPALIHPGRNRDALKEKRDNLLEKLFTRGYFDEETLILSLAEALPGEPLPLPRLAPHLLERMLAESGYNATTAFITTIDRDIQERSLAILNRASLRFAENGVMNGACIIINTQTGETIAYVGNTDTLYAKDVDIITSRRSSGSLLKPFLYAAMLDTGDILPSSLVSDIPTRVGSYSPENITRNYLGVVPADEALARSLNIPAVRSLRVYGAARFARFLRSLGLTTLFRQDDDYGLPLILGGAEVTLWEMVGLYAGLGRSVNLNQNEGETAFFHPYVMPKQNQSNAAVSVSSKPAMTSASLISPGAAWSTLNTLVYGVRPGEEAVWQEYANAMRIAWKTGTSFGYRDAWSIGVTPEWTVGVWIGNASGEGRAELRAAITAAPVMFELFSSLYSGTSRHTWFSQPAAYLRHVEVCAFSGFLVSANCASTKIVEVPLNAPAAKACPYCRTVILNETMDRRIVLGTGSSTAVVEQKWFVLPPAEEWYYRRWNLDYKPLPQDESSYNETASMANLALFNPEPGSLVFIPRELDGTEGRIVFSAAHREDDGIIYWHLDETYLGATQYFHEMEARPQPGLHTLTLVDSSGNTLVRSFTVLDTGV
ncbi:MAG: penicillin-binding protein 1C [Treponema sp.]|jgi:penicillin-binding protein 1C|nr:penicillin-binding protein 1C [Treponema sp.]